MLYFIGLGLGDEEDITVKGLNIIRKCSRVYLEAYTSILGVGKERLVRKSYLGPLWSLCLRFSHVYNRRSFMGVRS